MISHNYSFFINVCLLIIITFFPFILPFDATHYSLLRLSGAEKYKNGAVAAEHPACSTIGVSILQQGGSAVDAAIAGLLCVGVINNFAAGIGGGGFMLVRDADGSSSLIDFRETAPLSAKEDMFNEDPSLATNSTRGAGVPGEIRGFWAAHQRYGRLSWEKLFTSAIDLAQDGFIVTRKLEDMIRRFRDRLAECPGLRATYLNDDGTGKRQGQLIRRPNLARTLLIIAQNGPDAFYEGVIAESLASEVVRREGGFTIADLMSYQVKWRDPLTSHFSGFKVITGGPPTSGPIVIQLLKILEKLGERRTWAADSLTIPEDIHRLMESYKFAYVDRMKLGDPDFVVDLDQTIKQIISDRRALQIVDRIDENKTHSPADYFFEDHDTYANLEQHGTTHLTSMDKWGQTVAVTSTVNLEFGCRRMDPETGIILNNELDDFSIPAHNNSFGLPPSQANYVAPLKRPLSSSSPLILEKDGKVILAVGAAGGSRIITAVVDAVFKIVMLGMEPDNAVESCRLHHQLLPNVVVAEDRCDGRVIGGLLGFGHQVVTLPERQFAASVNLIYKMDDGVLIPVSDSRKGGVAAGY